MTGLNDVVWFGSWLLTLLFQGIVTMTPTVMNSMIHMDMSEVIRIIISNGMILYALTRKTEGSK